MKRKSNFLIACLSSLFLALVVADGGASVGVNATSPHYSTDPTTYYESLYNGSTLLYSGTELLGKLHDLMMDTHQYYSTYDDCKDLSIIYAMEPGTGSTSENKKILDYYTHDDLEYVWEPNSKGGWNREHVWCQSLSNGLWGTSGGGSDLLHVRPIEFTLNSTRNNNPYGDFDDFGYTRSGNERYASEYGETESATGALGGYLYSGVFEPLDHTKGDAARIIMYDYMHYSSYQYIGGTKNTSKTTTFGFLDITQIIKTPNNSPRASFDKLLEWNELDPVDSIEQQRNNVATTYQGNRNPFIDHPEYASAIWGEKKPEITLNSYHTELKPGQRQQLVANCYNSEGESVITPVTFTSSDTSKIAVDSTGKITAKGIGKAQVAVSATIESQTVNAYCQVEVQYADFIITCNNSSLGNQTTLIYTQTDCEDYTYGDETVDLSFSGMNPKSGAIALRDTPTSDTNLQSEDLDNYRIRNTSAFSGAIKSVKINLDLTQATGDVNLENIYLKTGSSTITNQYIDDSITPTEIGDDYVKFDLSSNDSDTYFAFSFGKVVTTGTYKSPSVVISFDDGSQNDVYVESVSLSESTKSIFIGQNFTLAETVLPSNATDKTVTWTSSSDSIATVTSGGVVTAVKEGEAVITCTTNDGSFTASCTVTVIDGATVPTSLTVASQKTTFAAGEIFETGALTLHYQSGASMVLDNESTNLHYYINSVEIEYGTRTLTKADNSQTVSIHYIQDTHDVDCSYSITVNQLVESIAFDKDEVTLNPAETATVIATVSPADADNKTLTWTTSDDTVATVSDGVITAVAGGEATVYATSTDGSEVSQSITVNVNTLVTSVKVNKSALTLEVDETETLTATVLPEDATNKNLNWVSSDETVATVDQTGTITALKVGTSNIRAWSTDGSGKSSCCKLTVIEKDTNEYIYQKVTSGNLVNGGNYLIVNEANGAAFDGSLEYYNPFGSAMNFVDVTITDSTIEYSKALKASSFTYNSSEQSFKGASGKYFGYSGSTAGMSSYSTYDASSCLLTTSFDASGNFDVVSPSNMYLRFGVGKTTSYFRFYSSKSQNPIALYQKVIVTRPIVSLSYTGTPTKTAYFDGDDFDPTGITVIGTDDIGGEVVIDANDMTWDTLEAGDTSAIGHYEELSLEVTGITVAERTVESLSYTGTLAKTEYNVGDAFDPTGITVTATYNDESTKDVTDDVEWGTLRVGDTSVTGSYGGKTVTVTGITVTDPYVQPEGYKLVTSLDELIDGAKVIIGMTNGTKVMDATQKYSSGKMTNRNKVSATYSNGYVVPSEEGKTECIFIVSKVIYETKAYYQFYDTTNNGYLCVLSSSANSLGYQAASDVNSYFEITNDNGSMKIEATASEYTRDTIGQASSVFSAYDNDSQRVSLFSDVEGTMEAWSTSYMKIGDPVFEGEGTGLCKSEGLYTAAKTALLGMGKDYIELLEHSENETIAAAYERIQEWAKANGEIYDDIANEFIKNTGRTMLNQESGTRIIVIVCLVSVTVLGVFIAFNSKQK